MINHKKIGFALLLCATQGAIIPMPEPVWEPMAPVAAKNRERQFNKYSSAYFQEKFDTLLNLTAQKNPTIESRAYQRALANMDKQYKANLLQLLEGAHKTGLLAQYSSLLLGTNQYVDNMFILHLFSMAPLAMIAHLQNVCGGGKPFTFKCNTTDPLGKAAFIGQYVNPNEQKIDITYYGLLRGLIDSIDTVKKNYTAKTIPNLFLENLWSFEKQIDEEIKIFNGKSQQIKEATEKFESMVKELRTFIQEGNTEIIADLDTILSKYRQ